MPAKPILRYTSLASVIDALTCNKLTLLSPSTWDDSNDSYALEAYRKAKGYAAIYALCLTEAEETYHHWQAFGKSGGACIYLKKHMLDSQLSEMGGIMFESVGYQSWEEFLERRYPIHVDVLPFFKQAAFKDECEWRIVYGSDKKLKSFPAIPIEPCFISKVALDPWLPESLVGSVSTALRGIPGYENLEVIRSNILNNEAWKLRSDSAIDVQSLNE